MRPHPTEVRSILVDTIALEREVSARLSRLGVEHALTWNSPGESPHVDLRVYHSGNPNLDLEVRLTLGTKAPRRLRAFVQDSIRTAVRGIRVYLEVCHRFLKREMDRVVERIAQTIREIAHRFRNFGPHRLIGVRVSSNRRAPAMELIDLLRRAHLPDLPSSS